MIKLHRPRLQRRHRPVRRPRAVIRHGASEPPAAPEDSARYQCACGKSFTAAVTATVTCPACGDGHAW